MKASVFFRSIKGSFFVITALVVCVFSVTWWVDYKHVNSLEAGWDNYTTHVTTRGELLLEIKDRFGYGGMIHNFKNHVLRGLPKYHNRVLKNHEALQRAINDYMSLGFVDEAELAALEKIRMVADQYLEASTSVSDMYAAGRAVHVVDQAVRIDDGPALEAMDLLWNYSKMLRDEGKVTMGASVAGLVQTISLGLGLALLVIVVGLLWLSRRIIGSLNCLRELMVFSESNNDLTIQNDNYAQDEVGEMTQAFDAMRRKFGEIICQVSTATMELSDFVGSMKGVLRQSLSSVQGQLSETEQVATAVNEMTAAMREVANNAGTVANAVNCADTEAAHGKVVVTQTLESINLLAQEVDKASGVIQELEIDTQDIGAVLDVIKHIAEQTNLLALNAAIEAARAGEEGRGFAVVADEVRTLAQRTQASTNEIQTTIERLQNRAQSAVTIMAASRSQTENSVVNATQAGKSLDVIASAVTTVTGMVAQIAGAVEEQCIEADEVNKGVVAISQVAAGSREIAEDSSQACGDVAMMALQLNTLIKCFKVG